MARDHKIEVSAARNPVKAPRSVRKPSREYIELLIRRADISKVVHSFLRCSVPSRYGQVQSWTPQLVSGPLRQDPPNKYVEVLWGLLNCLPPLGLGIMLLLPVFSVEGRPGGQMPRGQTTGVWDSEKCVRNHTLLDRRCAPGFICSSPNLHAAMLREWATAQRLPTFHIFSQYCTTTVVR